MPKSNNNAFRPSFSLDLPASASSATAPGATPEDPLLGVLTRPAFVERLAAEKRAADARRATFTLCLVDVDHLRNINDRHGARVGDAVLVEIAERVGEVLALETGDETTHIVGRFDGDALIVLSRGSDLASACALAETLRNRVAAVSMAGGIQATVSAGAAQYRIGEHVDETLARLEQALYLAKQFGRDRVEAHPSPALAGDPAVLPFTPGRKPRA